MAVDERARKKLHDALERAIGDEEAATLMGQLPWVSGRELVTRDVLKQELALTKQEFRGELESTEERLRGEIHRVARTQLLAYTTVVAVLNGITFTALQLG